MVTFPRSTTSAAVYVRLAANAPAGTINGTIINFSGSQTANVGVTGTVGVTPPANQPPVATANSNQTATVGFNFAYTVNPFSDPNNDVLTYVAQGLPTGLTFNAASRLISGVASASGVSTVTITATDPGSLSASTSFTISVNPAPVVPPTNQPPVATANSNQTATVGGNFAYTVNAFTDPNNDVLTYMAQGLPTGLTFNAASRLISGVASASGVSTVTITATDPGSLSASTSFTISVNPAPVVPPTPGSFAIAGVTTVSCVAVTATERQLTFTPQYTGTTGQPISFSVVNELLPTTDAGPYSLRVYLDNPTLVLKATQVGSAQETSFSYNWLAGCNGGVTPPPPTPGSFAIAGVTTVSCVAVTATERQLTFIPQYTGTTGQPISFSVVNELLPTTDAGPYSLRVYLDNPTLVLKATQVGSAQETSFSYNWLAGCSGGNARMSAEPTSVLQIRVLGNPVRNAVEVEITGVQGQALDLSLIDMQSRSIGQYQTDQAGAVERHRFNLSTQSDGVLLLRASTSTQTKTVRILKAN